MGIYDGNQTFYQMDMIPDPKDCTFGRQGRTYDPSQGFLTRVIHAAWIPTKSIPDVSNEAKFDPSIHLDLQLPKSISIFEGNGFKTVTDSRKGVYFKGEFTDVQNATLQSYKNRGPDSKFAHSEVFKVFSEEGAAEARRICLELKKYAEQDARSCKLRNDFQIASNVGL